MRRRGGELPVRPDCLGGNLSVHPVWGSGGGFFDEACVDGGSSLDGEVLSADSRGFAGLHQELTTTMDELGCCASWRAQSQTAKDEITILTQLCQGGRGRERVLKHHTLLEFKWGWSGHADFTDPKQLKCLARRRWGGTIPFAGDIVSHHWAGSLHSELAAGPFDDRRAFRSALQVRMCFVVS